MIPCYISERFRDASFQYNFMLLYSTYFKLCWCMLLSSPYLTLHGQGQIYSQQGTVQKKMWVPSTGAADPIFPGKTGDFSSDHLLCVNCQLPVLKILICSSLSFLVSLGRRPFFWHAKINLPLLLWGPFLWGPLFG